MSYPMQPPNQGYGMMPGQAPQYAPPQQYQQPAPQGYGVPPQQYGAPQGYGAPQHVPPPVQGTLDDFFNQPSSGGGPGLKFPNIGSAHVVVVTRQVTDADVSQQTQPGSGVPSTFKDGRPKYVMKVPVIVATSADNPEGTAQWFVQGGSRDELVRAMQAVGAPRPGQPEQGSIIYIAKTGQRPSGAGLNPASVFQVTYFRPGDPQGLQYAASVGLAIPPHLMTGATAPEQDSPQFTPQAVQQAQPPAQQQAPAPQQYAPPAPQGPPAPQVPAPAYDPPSQLAGPPQQVPAPQAQAQPQYAPPAPQAPPAPGPAPADPEKAALLAQLNGQAQG